MKPEDIKKERRLLKKSVNQLSHLLKREKAKREEVEQRLRDFSMEMQTSGGSVCGGGGGGAGSPTSSTAGQSLGTPVLTAGSRRGTEMGQRGNEEAAGSVSPDPKAQTTTTIAANGEGSSDRRGVTPSWTSMETPHIPLTGPTGGTPGRWARSATPEEQEAQLSRWAEELFEKEELMRKMFECIQTRENQLRSLTDSLRRRSAQLIDLHATLFREERMVILGEEMDEVHIGVGGDVSGSAVTA